MHRPQMPRSTEQQTNLQQLQRINEILNVFNRQMASSGHMAGQCTLYMSIQEIMNQFPGVWGLKPQPSSIFATNAALTLQSIFLWKNFPTNLSEIFRKIFKNIFSVSNEPETVKMSRTRDSERMDVPFSSWLDHGPTLLCHWCFDRIITRKSLLDLSEGWVWWVFFLLKK